jgi:prepilin-type N-terminal cleavage/methylation domain-containing protein
MDFMITITPSRTRKPIAARLRRGFTLVEVMVASTLASFVLAGVLSTFLFLGRSGANLRNYSDMESQARKALEMFAEDVRQASAITWTSSSNITLAVNSVAIAYTYNSSAGTFTRATPTVSQTLITGISSGTFSFKAYNVAGTEMPLVTAANLTAAGSSTKQLQISLEATRNTVTVSSATNLVLSARYILRNKIVTA